MTGKQTFYITTPIYYPDSDLHIGHAYTTVAADAVTRWHRLHGVEAFFLTGTDEHGQKIERRARELGREPADFVGEIVDRIRDLWHRLGIDYDDFIRTSEPRHKRVVQLVLERLYRQGDIYKSCYQGWYCTPCETFLLEQKLVEGNCPDCGRPVEVLEEEAYFFRTSTYAARLLEHIRQHPEFIQPESRQNEMINFIESGLEDLCVTRTSFTWGVPVPFDSGHVTYVWFDALINYLSALGYGAETAAERRRFETFWPADVHLVGKEIVRFHAVVWPIMLLAAGIELPRQVFGHGWLVLEGGKISKSSGNVIDPNILIDRYGADAVRYYLLREIPFGADGSYSEAALVARTDADLANDLGNLLSRTTAMIEKFGQGRIPAPGESDGILPRAAAKAVAVATAAMKRLEISAAVAAVIDAARRANKYIEEQAPWDLARDPAQKQRLDAVLYDLAELQRVLAVLLKPFLIRAPVAMGEQLGLADAIERATAADLAWGGTPGGLQIRRGQPLFPRIVSRGGQD